MVKTARSGAVGIAKTERVLPSFGVGCERMGYLSALLARSVNTSIREGGGISRNERGSERSVDEGARET